MLNKIKKVSIRDLFGFFLFILVLIPSIIKKIILKLSHKELWLICETEKTARDNGYVFYKYMVEKHPEIKCYYAIGYKYKDYDKVKTLGNVVKWSSIKHYYLYMSATRNISSHKEGNPNQTLFTILHLYLKLYNNRVFLQHGILYQNYEMFHKKNTRFKVFICGAKGEYDFINEKYGYEKEVKYTGLARFDNLHNQVADPKMILYMPTWRRYLTEENKLLKSIYYKNIMSFINSKELDKMLEENDKYLYFCPHGGLRDLRDLFDTKNKRVKIVDISKADIQQLLINGSLLITDYSSLHSDFAYMKKPIIYYQYDEKEFKQKHIGNCANDTYYNYVKDGFGKVVESESKLLSSLKFIIENNYKLDKKYLKRVNSFFELYDNKNCERIFEVCKNKR